MMEEKIIIVSKNKPVSKLPIAIAIGILSLGLILNAMDECTLFENMIFQGGYALGNMAGVLVDSGILITIIVGYLTWKNGTYELTVTNKRIYGTTTFKKHVDLPIDSVSSISTSINDTITISTTSGLISFSRIENYAEIHSEIIKLLNNRQNNNGSSIIQNSSDEATDIKKYKELLDQGIITQEEFDAKKKQLLGL